MKFSAVLNRATDVAAAEPILALFLGSALVSVFISVYSAPQTTPNTKLLWTLYDHAVRFTRALAMIVLIVAAVTALRMYLRHSVSNFQRTHGRVTQANYNSVQTIWGPEQQQGELRVEIYTDEEITERIESEDLTKPAILRKKTVRKRAPGNPFIAANHHVTLRQNSRKKGSALYGGYDTDCRFSWRLRNPDTNRQNCTLTFPLPATTAMYDDLSFTLNGAEILPHAQFRDGALLLHRYIDPSETMDLRLSFKSRGMAFWYFQILEQREIRDFTLTLALPDLPRDKLNYPEGCMTPTKIDPTPGQAGSILTYRLDHALSNKGMGVALPELTQPGAETNSVLNETDRAWLFITAMLLITLTLARADNPILFSLLFAATTAFAYGLLADFSDMLFGFWLSAAAILLPIFLILTLLLTRKIPVTISRRVAFQLLLFGLAYPCAAGLDPERQLLYLNLCSVVFLLCLAPLLVKSRETMNPPIATIPASS